MKTSEKTINRIKRMKNDYWKCKSEFKREDEKAIHQMKMKADRCFRRHDDRRYFTCDLEKGSLAKYLVTQLRAKVITVIIVMIKNTKNRIDFLLQTSTNLDALPPPLSRKKMKMVTSNKWISEMLMREYKDIKKRRSF